LNKFKIIIRFISALFFAAVCLGAFWVFGYEFDTRGDEAFMCFIVTVLHAIIGFVMPRFGENKNAL